MLSNADYTKQPVQLPASPVDACLKFSLRILSRSFATQRQDSRCSCYLNRDPTMNGLYDTHDSTDAKPRLSLAASIAKHEAAVEALKWHLEMDDESQVGRRAYSHGHKNSVHDADFTLEVRFSNLSDYDEPERSRRFRSQNPTGDTGDTHWSFRTEAAHLPTLPEFDELDRAAGVRSYLENKLHRQPQSVLIPPRTVRLPSPPPSPRLSTTNCTANDSCCWDKNCSRQRYKFGLDFDEGETPAPGNGPSETDQDELVAARYQYSRWDPRPAAADTSLDGPANWPYPCRPFFFRRAYTPSARYY